MSNSQKRRRTRGLLITASVLTQEQESDELSRKVLSSMWWGAGKGQEECKKKNTMSIVSTISLKLLWKRVDRGWFLTCARPTVRIGVGGPLGVWGFTVGSFTVRIVIGCWIPCRIWRIVNWLKYRLRGWPVCRLCDNHWS